MGPRIGWRFTAFWLMGLQVAACTSGFRARKSSLLQMTQSRFSNSYQFIEIPRIGLTGMNAVTVEGKCDSEGSHIEFRVAGSSLSGNATCQRETQFDRLFWRATADFSGVPDGAVIVMVQEISGFARKEMGFIEFKKDTRFCERGVKSIVADVAAISIANEGSGENNVGLIPVESLPVVEICSPRDWNDLAAAMTQQPTLRQARVLLRNHLDFTGLTLRPFYRFHGELVGGGFFIRNAASFATTERGLGIFGTQFAGRINAPVDTSWVRTGTDASNFYLGLENISIQTESETFDTVGALAGQMISGVIQNVWIRNSVVSGDRRIGGALGSISPQALQGTAVLRNIFVERTAVSARAEIAGGLVGEIGQNADVFETKLSVAQAQSPTLAGGLAGINQGFIEGTIALRTGATDPHVDLPEVQLPRLTISQNSGGIAGWNTPTGAISHSVLEGTFAVAGLNVNSDLDEFEGINLGGAVGVNEGHFSIAALNKTAAVGSFNTGAAIGLQRGIVSDVASTEGLVITPDASGTSTGGFVGRFGGTFMLRVRASGAVALHGSTTQASGIAGSEPTTSGTSVGLPKAFWGQLGGAPTLTPVFNGVLLITDPDHGTQHIEHHVEGFRILDQHAAGENDPLDPRNYVFDDGEGRSVRWNSPTILTSPRMCEGLKSKAIWVFPRDDERMASPPAPRIITDCR